MKAKSLRERLMLGRQIAAVTTAFMIPVSTSGQAIAVSIFVLLVALTVKREEWLVTFVTPAGRSVGAISVAIDWHVVVANPVRPGRGYRSLCKIVAYSDCNGHSLHSAGGASNRLRVFGGMSVVLALSFLSFFIFLPPPFHSVMVDPRLVTSGQAIAVSIFVLLVALTVKREEWLVTFATPAAAVPVGLFLLLLIGMSWSPTPIASGGGISHYVKLLLIPIAMAPAFTAREALQIGYGFLAGCLVVLVLSFLSFFISLPPPFHSAMVNPRWPVCR